jgi:hypothetical protein
MRYDEEPLVIGNTKGEYGLYPFNMDKIKAVEVKIKLSRKPS